MLGIIQGGIGSARTTAKHIASLNTRIIQGGIGSARTTGGGYPGGGAELYRGE